MAKKKPSDDYVPEPFSFGKAKGKLSDYGKQLAKQRYAVDAEIKHLYERLTGLPYTHERLANLLIAECGLSATYLFRCSANEIRSALQRYAASKSVDPSTQVEAAVRPIDAPERFLAVVTMSDFAKITGYAERTLQGWSGRPKPALEYPGGPIPAWYWWGDAWDWLQKQGSYRRKSCVSMEFEKAATHSLGKERVRECKRKADELREKEVQKQEGRDLPRDFS